MPHSCWNQPDTPRFG